MSYLIKFFELGNFNSNNHSCEGLFHCNFKRVDDPLQWNWSHYHKAENWKSHPKFQSQNQLQSNSSQSKRDEWEEIIIHDIQLGMGQKLRLEDKSMECWITASSFCNPQTAHSSTPSFIQFLNRKWRLSS